MWEQKMSWKPEYSSPCSGFSTSWSQLNQSCENQWREKENDLVLSEQEAHISDKKGKKGQKTTEFLNSPKDSKLVWFNILDSTQLNNLPVALWIVHKGFVWVLALGRYLAKSRWFELPSMWKLWIHSNLLPAPHPPPKKIKYKYKYRLKKKKS